MALWFAYAPVAYSDTNSYRRSAEAILGGWTMYDGTRTPGYPLFIAWVAPAREGWETRVWLAQMGLGAAITLLLFYLGWQVSAGKGGQRPPEHRGRAWLGRVVALAHTLNLGQLFFEASLLTETLTTFWLALTVAGVALWLYHPRWRNVGLALAIGVAAALTALTRPLFVYLPLWILPFLVWRIPYSVESDTPYALRNTFHASRITSLVSRLIAFLLPAALLLGGWVSFIHAKYGDWSLTTMTGYHLVQHTGEFFEYVPDEYADLRDTYLRYRDAHIAQYGTPANTIWEAIPEMQRASGLSFYDLSRTLARISVQLIREHPDLYLRNVVEGWWLFWRAPVYWSAEALRWSGVVSILRVLILIERGGLMIFNLAFIVGSILAMGLAGWRRATGDGRQAIAKLSSVAGLPSFLWFLAGTIWLASVLQTLLDHGDNPRFLVPLQSVVVLWIVSITTQGSLYPAKNNGLVEFDGSRPHDCY